MHKAIKMIISIFLFLFLWQLISFLSHSLFLPGPIEIIYLCFKLIITGEIFEHIFLSVKRVVFGFLCGLIIGFVVGVIVGLSKLGDYINPILELFRPIPPIAWIPLAILWFGIGDSSSVFIIFIAAFFPVFTNTFFGVKSLPKIYSCVSKNLSLTKMQRFYHVILPFVLPYTFVGSRVSLGLSWMVVIAAEMISANFGLGYLIEVNRSLMNTDLVIATMLFIGLVGFLLSKILSLIEKKVIYWRSVSHAW
ncbi:MAG: ABC transporter permease [Candidatus ainarchaeum sp.]|nr:ABC transporter permease [Candidatus ainarchaeum sp.]